MRVDLASRPPDSLQKKYFLCLNYVSIIIYLRGLNYEILYIYIFTHQPPTTMVHSTQHTGNTPSN